MRLILVRHGQTEENVKGFVQGPNYGTLSSLGLEQIKKVAQRLKEEHIDFAYSSDYPRAKKTAEEIISFHPDVDVVYTKELRERNSGIFEGRPRSERTQAQEAAGNSYHDFKPEGGESVREAQVRVLRYFKETILAHSSGTVLVVGHGGSITPILLYLFNTTNEEYDKYHPENTAVTIIEFDSNDHTVHLLNCIKHLE